MSFVPISLIPNSVPSLIMLLCLNCFLIIATYTDVKYMKIKNKLNLAMLASRLLFIPFFTTDSNLDCLVGAFVLALCFFIPAFISYDSIGGDIKLAFNIGLWTGTFNALFIALISTVLNFIYRFLFVAEKDKDPFVKKILGTYIPFKAASKLPLAPFFYISYIIMLGYQLICQLNS